MTATARDFAGFPRDTITCPKDLKANNNRDSFAENRQTCEYAIKQPTIDFLRGDGRRAGRAGGQPAKFKDIPHPSRFAERAREKARVWNMPTELSGA